MLEKIDDAGGEYALFMHDIFRDLDLLVSSHVFHCDNRI
jgi:hypothetical protein